MIIPILFTFEELEEAAAEVSWCLRREYGMASMGLG